MSYRVNPLSVLLNRVPKPLRNKYIIALIIFFLVILFLDKHNILTQLKLSKSINQLDHDKEYYSRKIDEAKQDKQNIEKDKEKFAREKYHMHKSDEDVFIIEKEN
jgi:cell division protein FtsB